MSMLGEQGLDRRPKDGTTVQELVDPDPRYPRISRRIYGDPEIMGLERRRNLRTRVVLSRPRVGEPGAGRRRGARARRRARDPHTRAIRERWPVDRPRADFERDVWHADEILQGLDPLSRFACLVDVSRESTADTQVMARTLFAIHQEPARRVILRAARDDVGDRIDLTVSVVAPSVVAVDPYPLADAAVVVEVASRVLEDRPYGSPDEAAAAYHAAPVQTRRLSFVGANAARS